MIDTDTLIYVRKCVIYIHPDHRKYWSWRYRAEKIDELIKNFI